MRTAGAHVPPQILLRMVAPTGSRNLPPTPRRSLMMLCRSYAEPARTEIASRRCRDTVVRSSPFQIGATARHSRSTGFNAPTNPPRARPRQAEHDTCAVTEPTSTSRGSRGRAEPVRSEPDRNRTTPPPGHAIRGRRRRGCGRGPHLTRDPARRSVRVRPSGRIHQMHTRGHFERSPSKEPRLGLVAGWGSLVSRRTTSTGQCAAARSSVRPTREECLANPRAWGGRAPTCRHHGSARPACCRCPATGPPTATCRASWVSREQRRPPPAPLPAPRSELPARWAPSAGPFRGAPPKLPACGDRHDPQVAPRRAASCAACSGGPRRLRRSVDPDHDQLAHLSVPSGRSFGRPHIGPDQTARTSAVRPGPGGRHRQASDLRRSLPW